MHICAEFVQLKPVSTLGAAAAGASIVIQMRKGSIQTVLYRLDSR
jgi:hypothetical protein